MNTRKRQEGATLLVALVMLIMLTLFAVSAMNTSTTNLKVVGNMQLQTEAASAAQQAIELAISTPTFFNNPNNAIPSPCGNIANTMCVDLNNDGVQDLRVKLDPPPRCSQARAQKISELILTPTSEDLACVQAQAQGTFGIAGSGNSGDSLCGHSVWDVTANTLAEGSTVSDSPVNLTLTQGVAVRIKALDIATNCP